jgi:hypothetical protein
MTTARHVCLYQDSPEHFVSAQLAVLSIVTHEPFWKIHMNIPDCPDWLERWLARFSAVRLYKKRYGQSGWDVKPEVILAFLELLKEDVMWCDSDILLTGAISPFLARFPPSTIVVAEEPPGHFPSGSLFRTRGWGFPTGRSLSTSINSGFIRVSASHSELLSAWRDALQDERYRAVQAMDWWLRPGEFYGDQDALSALLGSKDYSDIPIAFLQNGVNIAQCHGAAGYSPLRRIVNFFGRMPALIHAQGKKPWLPEGRQHVFLDVSPYKLAAMSYRSDLEDTDWLRIHTMTGKILMKITFGEPNLAGLMPSLIATSRRAGGRFRALFRTRRTP